MTHARDSDFSGTLENEHVKIQRVPTKESLQAMRVVDLVQQKEIHPVMSFIRDGDTRGVKQTMYALKQTMPSLGSNAERGKCRRGLKDFLYKRLPWLSWGRNIVTRRTLLNDLIAGITVGTMAIPQSMSYASIAGLPYVNGMYTAFLGPVIYFLFGTSRQLVVGPVAMESLILASGLGNLLTADECPAFYKTSKPTKTLAATCPGPYTDLMVNSTLCVGLLEVATSILGLGYLLRFMGHPVTVGFTSGSAVVIMTSQLKDLFGVSITYSEVVQGTLKSLHEKQSTFNWYVVALCLGAIAYLFLHKFAFQRLRKRVRFLGIFAPLGPLIVIVATALMVQLDLDLRDKVKNWVGKIPTGLPPVSVSSFSSDKMLRAFPTALSAFIVGDMEAIAIAKGLALRNNYVIDSNQELLAQGITNVFGSLFCCYTATGSFSRSAVNNDVGAQTQMGALISGIVMMLTLLFLTPLFYFVPKYALAAIIIQSVLPLLNVEEVIRFFKKSKLDFLVWLASALMVMFWGILEGILGGIVMSLGLILWESANPQLIILWRIPGTTIYRNIKQEDNGAFIPNVFILRIGSSLYFANAAYVKDMVMKYVTHLEGINSVRYTVLEMTPVTSIDYTAAMVLNDLVKTFRNRGIEMAFAMVGERLKNDMIRMNVYDKVGEEWFFDTVNEAVKYCLRHQHQKLASSETHSDSDDLNAGTSVPATGDVLLGNEVGVSNEISKAGTTVFINLQKDFQGVTHVVTGILLDEKLLLDRAQVEVLPGGGARHRYTVRSSEGGTHLTEQKVQALQRRLAVIFKSVPAETTRGQPEDMGSISL